MPGSVGIAIPTVSKGQQRRCFFRKQYHVIFTVYRFMKLSSKSVKISVWSNKYYFGKKQA